MRHLVITTQKHTAFVHVYEDVGVYLFRIENATGKEVYDSATRTYFDDDSVREEVKSVIENELTTITTDKVVASKDGG